MNGSRGRSLPLAPWGSGEAVAQQRDQEMLLPPRGTRSMSLVGWGLEKGLPRGHCAGGELCCSLGLAAAPTAPQPCPHALLTALPFFPGRANE